MRMILQSSAGKAMVSLSLFVCCKESLLVNLIKQSDTMFRNNKLSVCLNVPQIMNICINFTFIRLLRLSLITAVWL